MSYRTNILKKLDKFFGIVQDNLDKGYIPVKLANDIQQNIMSAEDVLEFLSDDKSDENLIRTEVDLLESSFPMSVMLYGECPDEKAEEKLTASIHGCWLLA